MGADWRLAQDGGAHIAAHNSVISFPPEGARMPEEVQVPLRATFISLTQGGELTAEGAKAAALSALIIP